MLKSQQNPEQSNVMETKMSKDLHDNPPKDYPTSSSSSRGESESNMQVQRQEDLKNKRQHNSEDDSPRKESE